MIDCGSGWTRIEKFSVHSEDGMVHLDESTRLPAPPIAKALAGGDDAQRDWLKILAEHVDPTTPLLIGGTGGVRGGLRSGSVSSAQIESFERLVGTELGPRAQFRVIDGEAEALSELEAVRYCLSNAAGGSSIDEGTVALMSSGGMSSQIVFEDALGPSCHSLETKIKMGNGLDSN